MTYNRIVMAVFLVLGVFVSAAPVQVFGTETVGIDLMDKEWVQFVAGVSQPTPLPLQAATHPEQPTQPTQPEQPTQPTQPTQPITPKKPPKPPTKVQRSQSG